MTEVQSICRNSGATYPNPVNYTPNSEQIVQLYDLYLLLQMLKVAFDATGTPSTDGTITYYGHQLTRAEFPQAFEIYVNKIHDAYPEYSATKKIQTTIAALADLLPQSIKNQLGVPNIPNLPNSRSARQDWIKKILSNSSIMRWVNTLNIAKLNEAINASTNENDKKILENLKKLVSMLDIARTATGNPTDPSLTTMTGLGCSLSGAPTTCSDPQTDNSEGTYDIYISFHNANPYHTATSKVKKTLSDLLKRLPENYRSQFRIDANWVAGLRVDSTPVLSEKISQVKQAIISLCGKLPIIISSVTPNSIKQGEAEVTVNIVGEHLPSQVIVTFALGGNNDNLINVSSIQTNSNGTEITFKVIVNPNAQVGPRTLIITDANDMSNKTEFTNFIILPSTPQPSPPPSFQCMDNIDNDGDGLVDRNDPGCEGPEDNDETDPAAMQRARFVRNTLKLGSELTLGLSSANLEPGEIPTPQQPLEPPNLSLSANLGTRENPVTIWGNEKNALITGSPNWFELRGNFGGNYQQAYHLDADDNISYGVNLGLAGRFYLLPQDQLKLDLYFHNIYQGTDYQAPNRYLFSGHQFTLNPGVALESNFGKSWLSGRIFGEYLNQWFWMNDASFPGGFSGQNQLGKVGARLSFSFNTTSQHQARRETNNFRLSLEGAGIFGRGEVPETIGGSSFAPLFGGEFKLRFDWDHTSTHDPWIRGAFVEGGYSEYNLAGFKNQRFFGQAGLRSYVGTFAISGQGNFNPALYYHGREVSGGLVYTLSPDFFPGADAISIFIRSTQYYQDQSHNPISYEGGIFINPVKLILDQFLPKKERK